MTKNVLLIGGAGFIGSNLVKRFYKDTTYRLFILETPSADLQRLKEFERITLLFCDLKDQANLNEILERLEINIVIHLVSTLLPGSTLGDYQHEVSSLMLPTMGLLELCSKKNIKFIFFSSGGTIYGNTHVRNKKETDKLAPISYYGLSKCMLEEAIRFEGRRSGLRYIIVRPSNPYGHGQSLYGRQGIIAVALGKYLKREKLTIWGDGKIIRDYIFIDDLACCVYQLIENNIENEIVNVGSGQGYSINEIIQLINDYLPSPIETEYKDRRVVDVQSIVLDIKKLQLNVEFKPTGIQEGIQSFICETKQIKAISLL